MMMLILDIAKNNPLIRVVGMEGSRTNKNIPTDEFQDFDISYLVTDMEPFFQNDKWLDIFGRRIILQKPEDMELFSPDLGGWFSYLMIFEDGNKLDLTLVPLEELDAYLNHDKLLTILLDKDHRIDNLPIPNDEDYHLTTPTLRSYDDCQNEFWFVSTYVAKGLCRGEYLFAVHHYTEILQKELLRMIGWWVGINHGFSFSVGKSYKFLDKYLSHEQWLVLQSTFKLDSTSAVWESLLTAIKLMGSYSKAVGNHFTYPYPSYDDKVSFYIAILHQKCNGADAGTTKK